MGIRGFNRRGWRCERTKRRVRQLSETPGPDRTARDASGLGGDGLPDRLARNAGLNCLHRYNSAVADEYDPE